MKILVTGGAGFIGSNFVKFIHENKKHDIVVLDNLTYAGRKENLQGVIREIEFVKGDICDKKLVEKLVCDMDFIVNFAAETHVDRSIIDSGSFFRTDLLGTVALLEATKNTSIKKFVHISTDEVYGPIENGSFKETDRLNPRNPYSSSKAAADLICMSYVETYGVPVVITRSTNNYGEFNHPEKFITKSIVYAILNKAIPIYGSGKNMREWVYVKDNVSAINLVLEKGKVGEIYNISGKEELSNTQVVKLILERLGKSEKLIKYVEDRPGHDTRYSLDIEKIKKLGWAPKTKFVDGIEKTIMWYKENEWFWKPIVEKQKIDFHESFGKIKSQAGDN